ncbi:MAG: hypothetical protein HC893_08270 [Chloroflexaceae bacterium]|nr:hypothetical protein [Chloroflexaceae bacterium]
MKQQLTASSTPITARPPLEASGGLRFLRDLPIGSKLTLGFGLLVVLTLIVIALSLFASNEASSTISSTNNVRQPTALAASRAEANLLRMFGAVRTYLALGEPAFREAYDEFNRDFATDLARLEALSTNLGAADQQRLVELRQVYERWQQYPDQLFALRDNQMDREPAYALLNTTGTELGGNILINTNELIEEQAQREPSETNNALLKDMADFQSSFSAMFSGLRGYVMTRNSLFRYYEYEINLDINNAAWERLQRERDLLTDSQQTILAQIENDRNTFLEQVPEEAFTVMESPSWRRDLELFSTEVVDLTSRMETLLSELVDSQQAALEQDLERGNASLTSARRQTLIGGVVAVLAGLVLAFSLRQNIAGPVRRLTTVAEQIRTAT